MIDPASVSNIYKITDSIMAVMTGVDGELMLALWPLRAASQTLWGSG